jgi:hypothetical protein
VGRIYQQFSCLQEGRVQNIIKATLPPPPLPLLAGAELAVTLVVEAGYEARTARSIALSFRCGCGGRGRGGTIGSFLAASWQLPGVLMSPLLRLQQPFSGWVAPCAGPAPCIASPALPDSACSLCA